MTDEDVTRPIGLRDTPAAGSPVPTLLLEAAVAWARSTVGERETPPNSNRSGPIDQWIRNVGLDPEAPQRAGEPRGYSYCAAWAHSAFLYGARAIGAVSPCPRTASALRLWELADHRFRIPYDADHPETFDLATLRPGVLGIENHGGGKGHVYMVLGLVDPRMDLIACISPNSSTPGDRDGGGVVLQNRPISRAFGFIAFDL